MIVQLGRFWKVGTTGLLFIRIYMSLLVLVKNANKMISRHQEMPMTTMLEVELFDIWGINFMAPFVSSYGHKCMLVVVDCMSKWVEAVDLANNKGKRVVTFLKRKFSLVFVLITQL